VTNEDDKTYYRTNNTGRQPIITPQNRLILL
jgi:hypothetical protein